MRMEQDALAVSRGFSKNPIYTESCRCYETYRFYRLTDLRICTTFAARGPTRARARSTTRSVAARRDCWQELGREHCVNSFPRAHAREVAGQRGLRDSLRRGRSVELLGGGAAGAMGRFWHTIFLRVQVSSWGHGGLAAPVVQECRQLVGAAQACGVVGRRGHAHARMQKERIGFGTKSAYFWRQSGCTARIRKAWRWRGSAGSSTYSDAGVAVARERGITSSWECGVATFLTCSGRLSK